MVRVLNQMNKLTYYEKLSMEIEKLKSEGKLITIKHLPTTINHKRRNWL